MNYSHLLNNDFEIFTSIVSSNIQKSILSAKKEITDAISTTISDLAEGTEGLTSVQGMHLLNQFTDILSHVAKLGAIQAQIITTYSVILEKLTEKVQTNNPSISDIRKHCETYTVFDNFKNTYSEYHKELIDSIVSVFKVSEEQIAESVAKIKADLVAQSN